MGTDHHWVAVNEVVRRALIQDVEVHKLPPENENEVGNVAETVTDHLVGAFTFLRREA